MKLSKLIDILAIMVMGFLFSGLFAYFFTTKSFLGFNLLRRDLIFFLFYLLIFIRSPQVYFSDTMKLIYLYYAIFYLMRISGHYDIDNQWFMAYHYPVFSAILIHNYYVDSKDYHSYAKVVLAALIFVGISAISNIYTLIRYPEAARQLFGESSVLYTYGSLIFASIGRYGFVSAVPFIIPMLVAFHKSSGKTSLRLVITVYILVILISLFLSSLTAPILIAALCLLFSLSGQRRFKASILVSTILLAIIAAVPTHIKSDFFYSISEMVTQKDLSMKMRDIGYVIETGIDVSNPLSSVEERAVRIPENLKAFASNPLFGTGYEVNSHIFWLNRLAQVGLFGTVPLVLILYHHLKLCLRRCDNYYRFYILVSFLLFMVSGFMKNIVGDMFYYLLLLVPGMYYLRYLKKNSVVTAKGYSSPVAVKAISLGGEN